MYFLISVIITLWKIISYTIGGMQMFFRKMVGLGILSVTALTCFNGVTNVHASDIISSQANEPLELSLDNVYNLE